MLAATRLKLKQAQEKCRAKERELTYILEHPGRGFVDRLYDEYDDLHFGHLYDEYNIAWTNERIWGRIDAFLNGPLHKACEDHISALICIYRYGRYEEKCLGCNISCAIHYQTTLT